MEAHIFFYAFDILHHLHWSKKPLNVWRHTHGNPAFRKMHSNIWMPDYCEEKADQLILMSSCTLAICLVINKCAIPCLNPIHIVQNLQYADHTNAQNSGGAALSELWCWYILKESGYSEFIRFSRVHNLLSYISQHWWWQSGLISPMIITVSL